jgi:hypothetical protein
MNALDVREGLMIYNSDTDSYWVYDGTSWAEAASGSVNIEGLPSRELADQSAYNSLTTAQKVSDTVWIVLPPIPSGYTASITTDPINAVNENNVSIAIDDGVPGEFFDYTFTTSGGPGTFSGYGVLDSSVTQISGIDLSSLEDGDVFMEFVVTNAAGSGLVARDTVTKSTASAPSGYAVNINQNPIDSNNETAVSFDWDNAEVGASYDYEFTSSGGGTPVGSTGTISSAEQVISGIDLSGLTDGTITLTASLDNGLAGPDVTDTSVKNTVSATDYYVNQAGALDPGTSTAVNRWFGGTATVASSTAQLYDDNTTSLLLTSDGTEQFRQFFSLTNPSWTTGETVTIQGYVYAPSGASVSVQAISAINKTAVSFTPDTWTFFTASGTATADGNVMYLYTDSAS